MNRLCEIVSANLLDVRPCVETENGVRVWTTCVYPGFDSVYVYVVKSDDGYIVHDASEALYRMEFDARNEAAASRAIQIECARYGLKFENERISCEVKTAEWIGSAVIAVANTAPAVVRISQDFEPEKPERNVLDEIYPQLASKVAKGSLLKNFECRGASGRRYKFDLAVNRRDCLTLISFVDRNVESVNSNYVAFADVPEEGTKKIAAHRGDMAKKDIMLFQRVATVARPPGVVKLVTGEAG